MQVSDVLKIYEQEKETYLKKLEPQKHPKAFILGGQPACGKGGLALKIEEQNPNDRFLFVNGDNYRIHHPNFRELKNNSNQFSSETQIFSNVFTEKLIEEAIKNKYNIIVEGTMRNPQTPYNTAGLFRRNGYSVEVFCISAPALFTEMQYNNRYQEEINYKGWGRLAEKQSHDNAVVGLLKSLDVLYNKKAVDKIHLYSFLAKEHIETFSLKDKEWDIKTLPSEIVTETRETQLKDKEVIQNLINRGNATYNEIDLKHKAHIDKLLTDLEDILENLQDRKRGFRR